MGCVYAYVILLTFLGPEMRGRSMEAANDQDLAEAAGQDVMDAAKQHGKPLRSGSDGEV